MPGKLIALYGINNLGKTTQAKRLVERLNEAGVSAHYLKYPLYSFAPSGPIINGYLRNGNPHNLTPREFQLVHIINRTQYDAALRSRIQSGEWVVVEDYSGTGIAWGAGVGIDEMFLREINSHLLREDLAFFLDGERFIDSREVGHTHESDDVLMEAVRGTHQNLAKQLGWIPIKANESRDEVHEAIWKYIKRSLS